jgi:hypothetical protein
MKSRLWPFLTFFCFTTVTAFAQNEFAGRWQADNDKEARRPAMAMELRVERDKLSGEIRDAGPNPLTIVEGTITGKKFTFRTRRPVDGGKFSIEDWSGEMTDDNTLSVYRGWIPRTVTAVARGAGPGFRGGVPIDPGPVARPPAPIVFGRM